MSFYKNVSGQKIAIYAHDTAGDAPKTGDETNITAQISKDGGATAATNDANPTELDAADAPGIYIFDLTQAETNAEMIVFSAVSATAGISIEPVIINTSPTWMASQVAQTADHAASVAAILVDTGIDIPALIAALNDLSAAQVNAEVDTALADYDDITPNKGQAFKAWNPQYTAVAFAKKYSNEGGPVELPRPVEPPPDTFASGPGAVLTSAPTMGGKSASFEGGALPAGRSGGGAILDAEAQAERRVQQVIRRLG